MRLVTNLPEFYNDICEVIRLFITAPEIQLIDAESANACDAHGDKADANACCEHGNEADANACDAHGNVADANACDAHGDEANSNACGEHGGEPEATVTHSHTEQDGMWRERFEYGGVSHERSLSVPDGDALERKKQLKRLIKHALYELLRDATGVRPPWGSLTGIRPTRLIYEAMDDGMSGEAAISWLCGTFDVSRHKAALLDEIVQVQRPLMKHDQNEFDLYIGIPFCTTRCSYCSFASDELGRGALVEPYIEALLREIELTGRMMRERGYRVRASYMGGGTPTALSAPQLERMIAAAQREFPDSIEWTCEAGRPDTIDRDKLQVLLDAGITRISINPQTLCDDTLALIGRRHTTRDIMDAYELARSMGFGDINMDLIAALPGEDMAAFERSMRGVCKLAPDSVTVHTLAIKRASKLHELNYRQADADSAQRMVELARELAHDAGYKPYYLYRQKYMAGNLENVGYARPGKACLYNIDVMEETTNNLALGAGAITKWIFPERRRIERAANVRNIELYIQRVDEMAQRKADVIDMYKGV